MSTIVIQYTLAMLIAGLLGLVSFVLVVFIAKLLERFFGCQREFVVGLLGIVGLAITFIGTHLEIRWLALGVFLWGWMALVVELGAVVLAWRLLCLFGSTLKKLIIWR